MSHTIRSLLTVVVILGALFAIGELQSWSVAFALINLCLISALMSLGLNIQWGYAGLFNAGVMGFAALGGVAAVLVSQPPVPEAWSAGGIGILMAGLALVVGVFIILYARKRMAEGKMRSLVTTLLVIGTWYACREIYTPAADAIEAVNPAKTGYLGGLGLPIVLSWPVGGLMAAGAAFLIGKVALGLRSDYLAIATLGISEIIIAMIKNEDWLTRGVKNVSGLSRPVPYEVELQKASWFQDLIVRFNESALSGMTGAARDSALHQMVIEGSSIFVKGSYAILFSIVLIIVYWLARRAQLSPWGRMMRAVRDNEDAASAMGKNVTARHLQIFVIGSAVIGVAGAMLTTLDGQLTPGSYTPLRFTFLIWVMVIVGGSGNNLGSILGAFVVWILWIEAEPVGSWLIQTMTSGMAEGDALKAHLIESAPHMRLIAMGTILLLVLRFSPQGLIPEQVRR